MLQEKTIYIALCGVESPEGYSNLRATPGGKIIGKVYNGNELRVDENTYKNTINK